LPKESNVQVFCVVPFTSHSRRRFKASYLV
jgi:hypothetical protein